MTHSLRSDLWWTIPFHALLDHFGIPIGSLTIKSTLARHTGVRRVCVSRQSDHVIGTYSIQPNRCTWVVLWLFCFRSTPQRSLIYGPLSRVLFGESLVVRLYSEIDQTYLSIEAQCVSHYYPRWTATVIPTSFKVRCYGKLGIVAYGPKLSIDPPFLIQFFILSCGKTGTGYMCYQWLSGTSNGSLWDYEKCTHVPQPSPPKIQNLKFEWPFCTQLT